MSELLFITPDEMSATSILGGNVDIDKYVFCIANVQLTVIEPLLGSKLYDKIISSLKGTGLTGDYKIIFDEYIKPITKNSALAEYIEISSYTLGNSGLFKHAPESKEIVQKDEIYALSNKYRALGQMFIQRFEKRMRKLEIEEYNLGYCDDEVSRNSVKLTGGWKL